MATVVSAFNKTSLAKLYNTAHSFSYIQICTLSFRLHIGYGIDSVPKSGYVCLSH